jgi:nitrate reductase NapE component
MHYAECCYQEKGEVQTGKTRGEEWIIFLYLQHSLYMFYSEVYI